MTTDRHVDLLKSTNVRFPGLLRRLMKAGAYLAPGLASRRLAQQFLTPMKAPTPERERRWIAGAQQHRLRCGDYDLAVSSLGLGGPQILLVHGWSGRGSQLGAFIEPLVEAGYEVNWFDLPAHGQSSGEQSALVSARDAVQTVSEWLGGAHTVIAHSMGAAATTLAAARGAEIGRMVYLCPPDDISSFLDAVGQLLGLPESIVAGARRWIEQSYALRFDELIPTRVAGDLTQPLLALHDPADREVRLAEVEGLVAAWPGARLELVAGLGHRRILRDPEVIRQVVDFVSAGSERRKVAA